MILDVGKKGTLGGIVRPFGYLRPEHGLELFPLYFDIAWRLGCIIWSDQHLHRLRWSIKAVQYKGRMDGDII
jgi:hypothetical protein